MIEKNCKLCLRKYITGADQCDIPNPGIDIEEKYKYNKKVTFVLNKLRNNNRCFLVGNKKFFFGNGTIINKDNDCIFFITLPKLLNNKIFIAIAKFFYQTWYVIKWINY